MLFFLLAFFTVLYFLNITKATGIVAGPNGGHLLKAATQNEQIEWK